MTEWEAADMPPANRSLNVEAPFARRPRHYGLPLARLGTTVWPNGDIDGYAKSEHGEEYPADTFDDVPPFIAELFHGVDLTLWANGEGDITVYDDGTVTRRRIRPSSPTQGEPK